MKKPKTTTIEIKKLQRIAEYYQFPMVVFFAPTTIFGKEKTRNGYILKKVRRFEKKLRQLCESYWGEE